MNANQVVLGRGVSTSTAIAWAVLACAAILLIAKNLIIDNSVVFHDEYVYRAWSDLSFSRQHLLDAGIVPAIPNRFYIWVYSLTSFGGLNAYDIAQLLNVIFWFAGTGLCLVLARRSGVEGGLMVALALALVTLPWSSYTKYFMPEAMYAAVYLGGVVVFMKAVEERRWGLMVATGFILGILYHVKPHGVIVLGIDALVVLCMPRRWKNLGGLVLGLGISLFLVRRVTPSLPHLTGNSMGIYTALLRQQLDHFLHFQGAAVSLLKELAYVAAGHLMMFFALCGLPFVMALGMSIPRLGLWVGEAPQRRLFARYLLLSTCVLMAVSIVFTALAGEAGHIHSRYYVFLWPLWMVLAAMAAHGRLTRAGAVCASVVTMGGVLCLVCMGPTYSAVAPISFISGSQEWGVVFAPFSLMVAVFLLLVLCSLAVAWTGRGTFAWLLSLAMVGGVATVVTAVGQKTIFRNNFTDGRDAVAVQQILGRDALEKSLVIGHGADDIDKFLFFMQASPFVAWLPDDGDVHAMIAKNPQVNRVILLSGGYKVPEGFTCQAIAGVRTCVWPAETKIEPRTGG